MVAVLLNQQLSDGYQNYTCLDGMSLNMFGCSYFNNHVSYSPIDYSDIVYRFNMCMVYSCVI